MSKQNKRDTQSEKPLEHFTQECENHTEGKNLLRLKGRE